MISIIVFFGNDDNPRTYKTKLVEHTRHGELVFIDESDGKKVTLKAQNYYYVEE